MNLRLGQGEVVLACGGANILDDAGVGTS